jgi:antitoxin VapB
VYTKEEAMNAVNSKTFRSGNSIALRLPRALGIAADIEMRIEQEGEALVVRPARSPAAEKAKLRRLIEALDALPAPGEIAKREPIEFPERPGLI